MELSFNYRLYYQVKRGQSLESVAYAFGVTPRILAAENKLEKELVCGQVLKIPATCNLYEIKGGEQKELLCGSVQAYAEKNKTTCLYPTQIVSI